MSDGYLNFCKKCVCGRVRSYRTANLDRIRAYDRKRGMTEERRERVRQYLRDNPEIRAKALAAWVKRHPHQVRASVAVNNAVRDGRLTKQPCEVCGDPKVEGHHDDYSRPLAVRWLCDTHHKEHHRNLREIQRQGVTA